MWITLWIWEKIWWTIQSPSFLTVTWTFPSFVDLNDDVVTFTKSQFSYLDLKVGNDPRLLDATILLSFRTKMHQGLLFYLYDDLNNFVQLEIKTGFRLVLSFNQFQTIRTLEVKIPGNQKMSESCIFCMHIELQKKILSPYILHLTVKLLW